MGDCLRAGIPSRYVTSQLGQLSLASLRGRLIEYQLRLGQRRECHLCLVAGRTLCDPIWHVSSRSGEAEVDCELLYPYTAVVIGEFMARRCASVSVGVIQTGTWRPRACSPVQYCCCCWRWSSRRCTPAVTAACVGPAHPRQSPRSPSPPVGLPHAHLQWIKCISGVSRRVDDGDASPTDIVQQFLPVKIPLVTSLRNLHTCCMASVSKCYNEN